MALIREILHPAVWIYAGVVVVLTRLVFIGIAYVIWLTAGESSGFLEVWRQWDANILLGIAEHGYAPKADSHPTAFFPLFPLLVRAVFFMNPVLAGMTINGLACWVAFAYLYRLAEEESGQRAGQRAVSYLVLFPTSVFLIAPYTEALFLAGAIPAFYYARRERWVFVGPFAAVATGTRVVGVFVLLGLVVEFLTQKRFSLPRTFAPVAALLVGVLPLAGYGMFLFRTKSDPLYFLVDQRLGWSRSFTNPLEAFLTSWRAGGFNDWIPLVWRLEVLAVAIGVAFTLWALLRGEWGLATFMGVTMAAMMTSTWYQSVPRVLLGFFPIGFLLATRQRYGVLLLATFGPLAALGVVLFTQGVWFF